MLTIRLCGITGICVCLLTATANAEKLQVLTLDRDGNAVPQTVVYALPITPPFNINSGIVKNNKTVVDQIDKEFVKTVTVIKPGMAVIFPNHDNIRHHVYSFSPAKTFELPLYKDVTPKPVIFDKVGAVALGCNIHDWMSAYIYVVDSPFFALTNSRGRVELEIPAGRYEIRVWHPRLKNPDPDKPQKIAIQAGQQATLEVGLELKKSFRPMRAPFNGPDGGAYR